MSLSLSAALGPGGVVAAAPFEQLDVNDDRQLTVTEAGKDTQLTTMWSTVGVEQGGVANRPEFSAFEHLQEEADDYRASPGQKSDGTTPGGRGADSSWGWVALSLY